MRTKNSVLNFLTSIIPFITFVILGFLKVHVWQDSLDPNVYALNQLFFQVFAYLSIAEAGIGALVQKEYYKLLIDEDQETICKYYTLSKRMLRNVCYIIMICGFITSFFLKYLAKGNDLSQRYMQQVFLLFLVKSLVEYFMFAPRFVLTADQKMYKINFQLYFYKILETVLETVLIYIGFSYVFVLLCSIILRIIMNLRLNNMVAKEYPWLHAVKDVGDLKIKGMQHVFIFKIASALQENIGALLISSFVNPISVIIYTNYKYITKYINDFVYQLGTAITSSLGNLLYGNDKNKGYETYEMVNTMFYFIASFLTISIGFCINSFIIIWVGKDKVLSNFGLFCMLFVFFHNIARRPLFILKDVFALYKELQFISILEAIITVVLSFGFVKYGIHGILFANVLAILVTNFFYLPVAIYKYVFNRFPGVDFAKYLFSVITIIIFLAISMKFIPQISSTGIFTWFVGACVYSLVVLIVLSSVFFVFLKSFRELCFRAVSFIISLKKDRSNF